MPASSAEWTVDMLDALPDDGQRYEIIDGELFVTPSPRDSHQDVVLELAGRLRAWLKGRGVGKVMVSPSDVRRGDHRKNRVQPDVHVIGYIDGARPTYPYDMSNLLFVAEVLSPGNPRYDLVMKRDLYMKEGVPDYWILDPVKRTITQWRAPGNSAERRSGTIEWHPRGASESLVLDIPEFFDDAFAD